jgi:hypothetical protein
MLGILNGIYLHTCKQIQTKQKTNLMLWWVPYQFHLTVIYHINNELIIYHLAICSIKSGKGE